MGRIPTTLDTAMNAGSFRIDEDRIILKIKDRLCDTADELLSSDLFLQVLTLTVRDLQRRNSRLIGIFPNLPPTADDIRLLAETFGFLTKLPADLVPRVLKGSESFFRNRGLLYDFVEHLYNAWRSYQRLVICDSQGDELDQRPFRTFNRTVESLTKLVRGTYRDIQENISGNHPRIYRQVRAGAEVATIALPKPLPYPAGSSLEKLNEIGVIRQVLIYPPLILNPPMNKRSGVFERVPASPLDALTLHKEDWLCYPAKVGPLVILVYFSLHYFELGFALCNLFELADDADLQRTPDAVYLYGVPAAEFPQLGQSETIFYDDGTLDGVLVGAVPDSPKYGYFGYLKKMVLTLHNVVMMKRGRLPYHGAMVHLALRGDKDATILLMGDTGAGKSETLEALRTIASEEIEEITIIADDMGSLELTPDGRLLGYGTETGAFVRLDDLQPGFAFGQIDRTIIMSPAQVNARVVLPVTTYDQVIKGYRPDLILYANNYDPVDASHPLLERFDSPAEALDVFRAGSVMSKGTTTSTGLVGTYFANVFGPEQYPDLHEPLAAQFFQAFFDQGVWVGQMRTRLGLNGFERSGPEDAARALLAMLINTEKL
jgi:energy-coupling factor transporter ATP-binding protein EcfA2